MTGPTRTTAISAPGPSDASGASANAKPDALRIEIISTEQGFAALKVEWDALLARTPHWLAPQSFQSCWLAWQIVGKRRARELYIVTARRGDELAMVWPLVRYRKLAWRVLRPLGTESTEYTLPLMPPEDQDARVAAALAHMHSTDAADFLMAPFTPEHTPLQRALDAAQHITRSHFATARIDWDTDESWSCYLGKLSSKRLSNIRRCRKRLSEKGAFSSRNVPTGEIKQTIAWCLEQKRTWLAQSGKQSAGIEHPDWEAFQNALVDEPNTPLRAWELRLDDRIIAASVKRRGADCLEGILITFDREFAQYGPGEILILDELEWAFARGLAMDFRIGAESYKAHFNATQASVFSYDYPLSTLGHAFVAARNAKRRASALVARLRTPRAN